MGRLIRGPIKRPSGAALKSKYLIFKFEMGPEEQWTKIGSLYSLPMGLESMQTGFEGVPPTNEGRKTFFVATFLKNKIHF